MYLSRCQAARGEAYGIISVLSAEGKTPDEIREELDDADIWYDLSAAYREEIYNVLDRIERDYYNNQEEG